MTARVQSACDVRKTMNVRVTILICIGLERTRMSPALHISAISLWLYEVGLLPINDFIQLLFNDKRG